MSEHIHQQFLELPAGELQAAYRSRIEKEYLKKVLAMDSGETVSFTEETLARTALVYREAIEHALRLYRAAREVRPHFDFELSVDETATPTTPEAHLFAAREAQAAGVRPSSLAPRFIGEFQKGIDYIGDPQSFERSLATHARALQGFAAARRYYHVTPDLSAIPDVKKLPDAELPGLLENRDSRQLVHITYREILRDAAFKA